MTVKGKDHPVAREYARLAPHYDERWSFYVRATINETLKRMPADAPRNLLDVGCGSGELLVAARERFPSTEFIGVDLSKEMLDIARDKLDGDAVLHPASADELPFPDEHFDALVSCNAFHYFRNPERTLVEFRRIIKPGGWILITDWRRSYPPVWILDRYLRCFNRAHHQAYTRREMQGMLADAGFEDAHVEPFRISLFWGLMTAKARKPDGAERPTGV